MRILILTLSLLTLSFAHAGELEFRTLSAQEGGESFSLQAGIVLTGESDDEYDYERNRRPTASTFDSVDVAAFVRVTPTTKFSISAKRNGFLLVGDFKPGTEYTVTIRSGLTSKEGSRLTKTVTKEVSTGNFSPRFGFKSKARYLPGKMQGNLPWEAVNVDAVEFEVRQVFSQNMHQWLTTGEYANDFVSEALKTVKIPVKNVANQIVRGNFSLQEFDALGQGVFVITAKEPAKVDQQASSSGGEGEDEEGGGHYSSYQKRYDSATVVVTNLTVVAKQSATGAKVWVMDTNDLQPVRGAQVDAVATSNRHLDQCKTSGSTAECTLAWKKMDGPRPYALIVRSGKDLTYVRFEDLTLPNDPYHAGKREYSASSGGFDGYVYSERDLYRPGETVKLAAMVRNSTFEAVPKLPLRWTITNPRGKVVRESVSDTSDMGIARMEYASTAAGDTGRYAVAVTSGKNVLHETSIMIEEFVPERIGLKVTPLKEVNVAAKQVQFGVQANYLFGPPVARGNFKVACFMNPAFKTIPGRADYMTGIFSKEARQPVTLDAKEGNLSDKGATQAVCAMEGNPQQLVEAFQLTAKVDVSEAGSGRATTKFGTAYVANTDTLVGLKLEGSKGRTIRVRGGLFDFKGGIKQNAKATLKARLLNVREHWYYTSGGYDSWRVEEVISPTGVEKTVDVAGGNFEFSIDAGEEWGKWIVRVVDTATGYTADLDAGYIGWYSNDRVKPGMKTPEPSSLKIQLSKSEASPGDKIQAMVEAPFKGRVLFAFETDRTLETYWVDVAKPGQVKIDLTVPEDLPNVYVTAMLLKDPVDGKRFLPARAWGAASVQVVPSAHRLEVKVNHPELNESRKTVTIQLSNKEKAATEYSIAVVDEGILQMTAFKSPEPLKRFFEARAMGVSTVETAGWTVAVNGEPGKTPGGDGAGGAGQKTMPVKLVSYWFPGIKSDSSGKAQVQVPLPAFQGKVRIMAVASAQTRMGSSSTEMTVRDPLVLQSTLPRFLTQGDKFQFPVNITNLSGKEQSVTVEVKVSGLVKLAQTKQTMTVADTKAHAFKFEADVSGVQGLATISVTAVSADGKLKSEEKFHLPVKPAGIEQTIRLTSSANQEVVLASALPQDWRKDYASVEASVSPMPHLNEMSHLEMLLQYPYGCIEQTTSATMPLLAVGDILEWVNPGKVNRSQIKDMVQKGIARVAAMQTASGGFGYWPGDGEPNAWGTAYATYMLLDAKKLGYDVPPQVLKGALDYLESHARNSQYKLVSHTNMHHEVATPLAIYVLAKGGRSVTSELRESVRAYSQVADVQGAYRMHGLNGENYFLLSAAAKLLGDQQSQKALSDGQVYSMQLTGAREGEYSYWSPMRSDGMRLAILEDLAGKHPASDILAQRVASSLSKKGEFYYSTQDVAWSVLALGKRLSGFKKVSQAEYSKITLAVNGKTVNKSFDVAGAPGFQFDGPSALTANLKVQNAPAQAGVFFYLKATGYTQSPPSSAQAKLKIRRNFYKRDGTQIVPSAIPQGETVFVELVVQNESNQKVSNVAIVDRVPAGFEIENPRLGRGENTEWMSEPYKADYLDMRDDRIQVFGDLKANASESVFYSARAVTKGRYTAPAAFVEAMYDPANFDYDQDVAVQIVDAKK